MVSCCECGFERASRWHWRMHEWVEQQRCPFRFGCRNDACSALHTLAEQQHKQAKQKLRQREWEAECGFCGVEACRYGSDCARSKRAAVAYDSNYEDEEDGWSVVGSGRGCGGADPVDRTDVANLGGPGRFDSLVEVVGDDVLGDEFADCLCDHPEFQFEIRKERRVRQQERRRQTGQQRKGRTARKRAATNGAMDSAAAVLNHRARKRLCWLGAKLQRTVLLWQAVIAEARTCYGAQDGQEWWLLVEQMTRCLADDEQFWRGAMAGVLSGGELVCVGEGGRMERSESQIYRFRKAAVDGKDSRFRAEKYAAEWKKGAAVRAKARQVDDEVRARRNQLPMKQRLRVQESEEYARQMGLHVMDEIAERYGVQFVSELMRVQNM